MKFISLFAGVGGFDLALERLGHECVYSNEWDKYCNIIYEKNFSHRSNGTKNGGSETNKERDKAEGLFTLERKDFNNSESLHGQHSNDNYRTGTAYIDSRSITEVPTSDIPDHELLVGGVPCQSWSIAGKRGGFEDERGNMWFQYARILRAKQPRYFVAENVKGLLSHDGGKSMERICEELCDCGYAIDFEVLNSKDFGVPQNRQRVIIIGIRLDLLDECQVF